MGFGVSGGIVIVENEKELPTMRNLGMPNARYDYYQGGKLKSSRFTDTNGIPIKSTHYTNHGNAKTHPQVPHSHDWGWVDGEWKECTNSY